MLYCPLGGGRGAQACPLHRNLVQGPLGGSYTQLFGVLRHLPPDHFLSQSPSAYQGRLLQSSLWPPFCHPLLLCICAQVCIVRSRAISSWTVLPPSGKPPAPFHCPPSTALLPFLKSCLQLVQALQVCLGVAAWIQRCSLTPALQCGDCIPQHRVTTAKIYRVISDLGCLAGDTFQ